MSGEIGLAMVLALAAAAVYGTGVALQFRVASTMPEEQAMKFSLLTRLARDPLWLVGLSCDGIGFFLEVAALHYGPLVVVQPLLMTAVVFALLVHAGFTHQPPTGREWSAVAAAAFGLGLFLVFVAPTQPGADNATTGAWLVAGACLGGAMAILASAGLRSAGIRRATLLGLAAGVATASMSVLARAFGVAIDDGFFAVVKSWEPYALIFGGILSLLLQQTAYQTGRPTVTLPLITIVDPVVSSVVGILLFGEYLRVGGWRGLAAVVAISTIVGGLMYLCRSPAVTGTEDVVADPPPATTQTVAPAAGGSEPAS